MSYEYMLWREKRQKLLKINKLSLIFWIISLLLTIFFFAVCKFLVFSCIFVFLTILMTYELCEVQYELEELEKRQISRFSYPPRLPSEKLNDYFNRLISILDGIDPKDVTPQYIQEQREKKNYPNIKYTDSKKMLYDTRFWGLLLPEDLEKIFKE